MARVLIVEDEPLIAMMLEDWLTELGHVAIGPSGTVEEALSCIRGTPLDAAILDVNLRGHRCDPVAECLIAKGVPFAFTSGDTLDRLGGKFAGYLTVSKPYEFAAITDVVTKLTSTLSRSDSHAPAKTA